jgi:hypothetical protein
MAWAYTESGAEMSRPDSEHGLHVDGPLTASDWKKLVGYILEEMVEQAKREGREGSE